MKRWLFLLLFFPVIAFGQFRMVSSTVTLDSTVNDSTYIIDVDFFSDQTAKGYFASGITADYRVFSQTGQLYDITAATNLTLSSGDLTIVEIDNDYVNTESAPVGQILVFDPQGDYITFTPFGNSNMGQVLQQAIGTYNAVVSAEGRSVPEWSGTANYEQFKQVSQDGKIYTNRTGTNTTTPPSSDLVNWELTNKSAILEEIEGRDTISQASHPFSVGDPLWYSGNYILAQDTGASVRVDGIVVEVIDANTFVRQRSGKFTLSSHGFTDGIQLYVQPDGTYSIVDTSNSLVYGYAVDANTIQIGLKDDQIARISDRYKGDIFNNFNILSRDSAIDYLYGISFLTKFQEEVATVSISNDTMLAYGKYNLVVKNADINKSTKVLFPQPSILNEGKSITVSDSSRYKSNTFIQVDTTGSGDSLKIVVNNVPSSKYFLDGGEIVNVDIENGIYRINSKPDNKEYSIDELSESYFLNGQRIKVSGSQYDYNIIPSTYLAEDGVFVIKVNDKAPGLTNLLYNTEYPSTNSNLGNNWIPFRCSTDYGNVSGPFSKDGAIELTKTASSQGQFRQETGLTFNSGDTLTLSLWIKNVPDSTGFGIQFGMDSSVEGTVNVAPTDSISENWKLFTYTFTYNSTVANPSARFYLDGNSGKKIRIAAPMLNYGTFGGHYIANSDNSTAGDNNHEPGYLYAVISTIRNLSDNGEVGEELKIPNGVFETGNYAFPGNYNARQKMKYAVDKCNELGLTCTIVPPSSSMTFDSTLIVDGPHKLDFRNARVRPTWQDSTMSVVRLTRNASTINREDNTGVFNLIVDPTSESNVRFRAAVEYSYLRRAKFENIRVIGNADAEYCFVDWLDGEENPSLKSIGVTFDNCYTTNARVSNYRLDHTNVVEIKNQTTYNTFVGGMGVYSTHSDLTIRGGNIETVDSTAIYYDPGDPLGGNKFELYDTYFENNCQGCSGSPSVYINNASSVLVQSAKFNNHDNANVFIGLDTVISAKFVQNTWNDGRQIFSMTPATTQVDIDYNYQVNQFPCQRFYYNIDRTLHNRINIHGCPSGLVPNITNRESNRDSEFSGVIKNSTIQGTVSANFVMTGGDYNLYVNSDSPDGTDNASVDVTTGATTGPNGESADVYEGKAGASAGSIATAVRTLPYSLDSTKTYNLSWYGYKFNPNTIFLRISLENTGTAETEIISGPRFWYEDEWNRYDMNFRTSIEPDRMTIQLNDFDEGDSISIANISLVERAFPIDYYETGVTALQGDSAQITVSDSDNILHIKGGALIDQSLMVDSLLDASGNFHYTTGTATPTTDLSGQFNITHGLGVEPTHLDIGNKSATEYHFKYSCGSTTCTITVTDGTGTNTVVPSTAISISWAAFR